MIGTYEEAAGEAVDGLAGCTGDAVAHHLLPPPVALHVIGGLPCTIVCRHSGCSSTNGELHRRNSQPSQYERRAVERGRRWRTG